MDVAVLSESLTDRTVRAIRLNSGRCFSITSFFFKKKMMSQLQIFSLVLVQVT